MSSQAALKDKFTSWSRRVKAQVKDVVLNDTPPGYKLKNLNEIPSMQAMAAFAERYRISSILPYENYDQQTGIYYNRDTAGFMLICEPATGLSKADLQVLNSIFNQSHPANACIQITMLPDTNVEPILRRWQKTKESCLDDNSRKILAVMSENRVKYLSQAKFTSLFSDQPYLIRNFHLIISYTVELSADTDLASSYEIENLKRFREGFKGTLKSAKIFSQNMDPEIFLNIINGVLNPKKGEQPQLDWNEDEILSRQMLDADTLLLTGSGASTLIHQGEKFSLIPFHVKQFPKRWEGYRNRDLIGAFFDQNLNYPCQFIATLTAFFPDQTSAKEQAKAKSMRATQMADSQVSKFVPAWKERKVDWDYTFKQVDNGGKLVQSFFQVILITPEGREHQCVQEFTSLFDSLGWLTSRSRYIPIHSLLGALPMGLCMEAHKSLRTFGMYTTRNSWTCTNVAPWIGEWKGTRTPFMLFSGRRGQVVYFNHFDNRAGNYNIACIATSGAGKSFLTQDLVFSTIGDGGRVFIIDAGHSYRNICKLLKGTYIDFGEGRPILNPFSKIFSKENLAKVEELSKIDSEYSLKDYMDDFMPMLIALLSQMASPHEQLDTMHLACLEKALKSAIEKYGSATTITRVAEMCLEQRDENNQIVEYAKNISLSLHSYTKDGMFGRYFEGENNIDLDNNVVVLELDALNAKGDLQSVVLLILMMQINNVMYLSGNKSQKKQVIMDEAWRFLGKGRAGDFIEEIYRVARKHGGSIMTITQTISDYHKSAASKAALANSDFVFYLRQKPTALTVAEKEGHIDNSDNKIEVMKSLRTEQGKYSEIAISSPDGMAVVRLITDRVTEKIYSTTATEVEFLRNAEKSGRTIFEAVDMLLERQAG